MAGQVMEPGILRHFFIKHPLAPIFIVMSRDVKQNFRLRKRPTPKAERGVGPPGAGRHPPAKLALQT
jgi:hypothetical protein